MNSQCLNDEQLICLYYDEAEAADCKEHMRGCEDCQQAFARLCSELAEIDIPAPDGGQRAMSEALRMFENQERRAGRDEIMTMEEVSGWLKVSHHNLAAMLHRLPHFIIDGQVRFNRRLLENHLFNSRSLTETVEPETRRKHLKVVGGRCAI